MATIRKRGTRFQVQVRCSGNPPTTKSFINRKVAENWARQTEVQIDQRSLPEDSRRLKHFTLGELVIRYRDTVRWCAGSKGNRVQR